MITINCLELIGGIMVIVSGMFFLLKGEKDSLIPLSNVSMIHVNTSSGVILTEEVKEIDLIILSIVTVTIVSIGLLGLICENFVLMIIYGVLNLLCLLLRIENTSRFIRHIDTLWDPLFIQLLFFAVLELFLIVSSFSIAFIMKFPSCLPPEGIEHHVTSESGGFPTCSRANSNVNNTHGVHVNLDDQSVAYRRGTMISTDTIDSRTGDRTQSNASSKFLVQRVQDENHGSIT